jgi:hypothetical protein
MSQCFKCGRRVALLPRHRVGECCHEPRTCQTCNDTLDVQRRRYVYNGPRGSLLKSKVKS